VVATPLYQLTPGVPAFASRVDLAIDDLGVQLGVALDVRHHPQDVPSIPIGEVGSEGRASKVDMATLINMTNLVEERGTIQDAVYVQDCATANGASLRHGEHRDFPFAKEEIKCVSVPANHHRLRVSGFTTINKKRADRESKRSSDDGARPNREAPGTFGLSHGLHSVVHRHRAVVMLHSYDDSISTYRLAS